MLKRLSAALAAGFVLVTSAFAAGTIPFSLSQQFDSLGKPLAGCKFYTIQAGTTSTPQNAYQDVALTLPLPNPQTCDAAGRLPQMFLADGSVKVRLTDKNGVNVVTADSIQVIGPSGGGGGGSTVDPTTVLQTGHIETFYGTGVLSGFVRLNGKTIGSSTSGATERANADCQALFQFLWLTDSTLVVSAGRGVSAAADWASNKTITLPDARGRALAGLNDMGNTNANILGPLAYTKGDSITLGSLLGYGGSRALATSNLPPYTPAGSIANGAITTTVQYYGSVGSGSPTLSALQAGQTGTTTILNATQGASSFTGTAQGGTSAPFDTVSPLMLITLYIKL